jgi:hypothetical protein
LIPPRRRGSVSRHIRPWGLVTAFRAFPVRPAVTPLDALCSPVLSADSSLPGASPRVTFAPAFVVTVSTVVSPLASRVASRATSTTCLDIDRVPLPPRWARTRASGRGRCRGVEHGAHMQARAVRFRSSGDASDRPEPVTSERCSDRASVLVHSRLGERTSRCSLDLLPLRGVPTRPLGCRPPLLCLLRFAPQRPKTLPGSASPHFRVSIRSSLGATR